MANIKQSAARLDLLFFLCTVSSTANAVITSLSSKASRKIHLTCCLDLCISFVVSLLFESPVLMQIYMYASVLVIYFLMEWMSSANLYLAGFVVLKLLSLG